MVKIKYAGYDIYNLNHNLCGEDIIGTIRIANNKRFSSVYGALKFVCGEIGTCYRRCDWCYEEDLNDKHEDGWVLHIIVDQKHKWANEGMIDDFKNDKTKLYDMLVNVFVENEYEGDYRCS